MIPFWGTIMSKKKNSKSVIITVIVTLIVLAGLTFAGIKFLLPIYAQGQNGAVDTQYEVYRFAVKIFPLIVGIVLIVIASMIATSKDDEEDEADKLPPNSYEKQLFEQPADDPEAKAVPEEEQPVAAEVAPEEKEEFANHIVNNTKMLTMLLDDILSTTDMDSGNYKIRIEEGESGFMAKAAISSAEHRLQPGVTMRYEQDYEGTHVFRTDPQRVQQILINLLTNSCKHTTEGEIVLRCSLNENPGEISYSVTDTGSGVPADQAEKIFERFTKLNDFVQGTGLGLSICRDIAGKMGARVYLDTTHTGKGARFVFVLPEVPPQDRQVNNQQTI